eukprot:scaffold585_cov97-Cylindrotheca_fusiformis.AAC.1
MINNKSDDCNHSFHPQGSSAVSWMRWWEIVPLSSSSMKQHRRLSGATRLYYRCQREFGWTLDLTRRVLLAYKDFLYASSFLLDISDDKDKNDSNNHWLIPSPYVHQMWQQHIFDTKQYAKDCQQLLGCYLHYNLYDEQKQNQQDLVETYQKTIAFIKEKTGQDELDTVVWKFQDTSASRTSDDATLHNGTFSKTQEEEDDAATIATASSTIASTTTPTSSVMTTNTNRHSTTTQEPDVSKKEEEEEAAASLKRTLRKAQNYDDDDQTEEKTASTSSSPIENTVHDQNAVELQERRPFKRIRGSMGMRRKQHPWDVTKTNASYSIQIHYQPITNCFTTAAAKGAKEGSNDSDSNRRSHTFEDVPKHIPLNRIFLDFAKSLQLDRASLRFRYKNNNDDAKNEGMVLEGTETLHSLRKNSELKENGNNSTNMISIQ